MEWDDMDAPREEAEKRRAKQRRRRRDAAEDLYESLLEVEHHFGAHIDNRKPALGARIRAALNKAR